MKRNTHSYRGDSRRAENERNRLRNPARTRGILHINRRRNQSRCGDRSRPPIGLIYLPSFTPITTPRCLDSRLDQLGSMPRCFPSFFIVET
jgi:hypothetical protein